MVLIKLFFQDVKKLKDQDVKAALDSIISAASADLSGYDIEELLKASTTIKEVTEQLLDGLTLQRQQYLNLAMRHNMVVADMERLQRQLSFGAG